VSNAAAPASPIVERLITELQRPRSTTPKPKKFKPLDDRPQWKTISNQMRLGSWNKYDAFADKNLRSYFGRPETVLDHRLKRLRAARLGYYRSRGLVECDVETHNADKRSRELGVTRESLVSSALGHARKHWDVLLQAAKPLGEVPVPCREAVDPETGIMPFNEEVDGVTLKVKHHDLLLHMSWPKDPLVDLDLSCIVLDSKRQVVDVVCFVSCVSYDGAIEHSGEVPPPEAHRSEEALLISLRGLRPEAFSIVFVCTHYRPPGPVPISRALPPVPLSPLSQSQSQTHSLSMSRAESFVQSDSEGESLHASPRPPAAPAQPDLSPSNSARDSVDSNVASTPASPIVSPLGSARSLQSDCSHGPEMDEAVDEGVDEQVVSEGESVEDAVRESSPADSPAPLPPARGDNIPEHRHGPSARSHADVPADQLLTASDFQQRTPPQRHRPARRVSRTSPSFSPTASRTSPSADPDLSHDEEEAEVSCADLPEGLEREVVLSLYSVDRTSTGEPRAIAGYRFPVPEKDGLAVCAIHRGEKTNLWKVRPFHAPLPGVCVAATSEAATLIQEAITWVGLWTPYMVLIEHCTALRPSTSLRGDSRWFSDLAQKVTESVIAQVPMASVVCNPAWLVPSGPRIGSFEVSLWFGETALVNVYQKSISGKWPVVQDIVDKTAAVIAKHQSARVYPLPQDISSVEVIVHSASTGRPVARASVTIEPRDSGQLVAGQPTRTNQQGRTECPLAPGEYGVTVASDAHLPFSANITVGRFSKAPAVVRASLAPIVVLVEGFLLDALTQGPLPAVAVTVVDTAGGPEVRHPEAPLHQGKFSLWLPVGHYLLSFALMGYATLGPPHTAVHVGHREPRVSVGIVTMVPNAAKILQLNMEARRRKVQAAVKTALKPNWKWAQACLEAAAEDTEQGLAARCHKVRTMLLSKRKEFSGPVPVPVPTLSRHTSPEHSPKDKSPRNSSAAPTSAAPSVGRMSSQAEATASSQSTRFASPQPSDEDEEVERESDCDDLVDLVQTHGWAALPDTADTGSALATRSEVAELPQVQKRLRDLLLLVISGRREPPSAAYSYIELPMVAHPIASVQVGFTAIARDECGWPHSSPDISLFALSVTSHGIELPHGSVGLAATSNGVCLTPSHTGHSLVASFTPPHPDSYKIELCLSKAHVCQSPLQINAMETEASSIGGMHVDEFNMPLPNYHPQTLRWAADEPMLGEVDVVLVVDEGGGMAPVLNTLRAPDFLPALVAQLTGLPLAVSVCFGAIVFKPHRAATPDNNSEQHPDATPDPDTQATEDLQEEVVRVFPLSDQPLGSGSQSVVHCLRGLNPPERSDSPAGVADALAALRQMAWRPRATKLAMFIGRSAPHGSPGIKDVFSHCCPCERSWVLETEALRALGVQVHSLSVALPSPPEPIADLALSTIAHCTEGEFLRLSSPRLILPAITHLTAASLDQRAVSLQLLCILPGMYDALRRLTTTAERVALLQSKLAAHPLTRALRLSANDNGQCALHRRPINVQVLTRVTRVWRRWLHNLVTATASLDDKLRALSLQGGRLPLCLDLVELGV